MTLGMDDAVEVMLTPRAYQMELLEHAKTQNTVIVLETGGGKVRSIPLFFFESCTLQWDSLLVSFKSFTGTDPCRWNADSTHV